MIDDVPLLGSQDPTFEWCPPFAVTYGDEAAALYNAAASPMGQTLDVYQVAALRHAMAVDPHGTLLCFEFAIILSRQNGKGEVLLALELAWLFLFGEPLIIHSAHLAETSREHFLKMVALIQSLPDLERRLAKVREGKGAEEIILKSGARLKFMTRSGRAGLGFTGAKVVCDEAMYLDVMAVAAAIPTMATKRNAQVVYAGSAGHAESTQLASVRQRGLNRDPAVGLMAWEARRPVYDERGTLVDGDDPEDPRTWARTNPTFGVRISETYVRKEAKVLGGFRESEWWRQRLGVGQYPSVGGSWLVVPQSVWEAREDPTSSMLTAGRALAVHADVESGVYTLAVAGKRQDGRIHVELIDRKRGSEWIYPKVEDVRQRLAGGRMWPIVVLKSGLAGHLDGSLTRAGRRVLTPSAVVYAQACQGLVVDLEEYRVAHIGQGPLSKSVEFGQKRKGSGGSWVWDLDQPQQSAVVAVTLAWWAVSSGVAAAPRPRVW